MRIPFDADLLAFMYTVGVIVFGSFPRLRKNTLPIPFHFNFEEVPQTALTEAQSKFLGRYDAKLEAMNYWSTTTYRATNFGNHLLRSYYNPAETSRCVVILIATTVQVNGKRLVTNSCTVEFITKFSDDRVLVTRNLQVKALADYPDYWTMQNCPNLLEPYDLKARHDSRAAQMGVPAPPPADAASIFREVNREHQRFSAYQVTRGLYQLHPNGVGYLVSDKTHWRGIRNFLNPFAHYFSLRSLLAAIALGITLPVLAILKLAPLAANAVRAAAFPPILGSEMATAAGYLAAGVLIGFLLERHTFVWAFLITYLGVHLIVGWSLQPLPYSLFASIAAHAVALATRQSAVVLSPRPAVSSPAKPFA